MVVGSGLTKAGGTRSAGVAVFAMLSGEIGASLQPEATSLLQCQIVWSLRGNNSHKDWVLISFNVERGGEADH